MFKRGVVVVVAVLAASCQPEMRVPDSCAGIDCGAGQCAVLNGAAACLCNEGYRAAGLTCAAIPPADLCASRPCEGLTNSLCLVNEGKVSCTCPEGRVAIAGACVIRTACAPNPCTTPRRTTCEVVSGNAECRCDPGFAPEGTGCSASPVWSCAAQHPGDAFEPDECPMVAHPQATEQSEAHTVFPAGDHDWFSIGTPPGRLMRFSATSTSVGLLIEVFDAAGTTLLTSDNRGAFDASITFLSPATGQVMVRVRAVRATDSGAYTVLLTDLGTDDYTNAASDAVTLVPAAGSFSGEVQYVGDLDVVKLELPARTAVRLTRPDAGPSGLVVELRREDGGVRVLEDGERSGLTVPAVETVVLTARGRSLRNTGAFDVALEELGPDDHAEEPGFGTPLTAGANPTAGVFERTTDIDTFRLSQQQGRIYSVAWIAPSWWVSGTLLDSNNVVLGTVQGSSGSNAIVWQAARTGTVTLRLQPYSSSSLMTYTVGLEDLGLDDHSNEPGNATPLTVGTPASGRLELSADIDTFSFTAVANRVMQVTASVIGAPGATVRVRVLGTDGASLGEGEGGVSVLASVTGTYKVQVSRSPYSGVPGPMNYQVTVIDSGADDHGNTRTAATSITAGATTMGSVQYVTDVDVFALTTIPNHVYAVSCTQGQGSCAYRIIDPSGQAIQFGASGAFLATSTGPWFIEVSSGSNYTPLVGPYNLVVNDLGPEDHGSTFATATALTLSTPVAGRVDIANDLDVFSVPVVGGHIYRVTLTGGSSVGVDVRTSNNAVIVIQSYGPAVSFLAPSTGTVYVQLSSYFGTATPYTITVEDRGIDDHGNSTTTATALTLGAATAGAIQYNGDVDFFSVPVVAGRHHRVKCTVFTGSCSVSVVDGAAVLANASSSLTAQTGFTGPAGVTSVSVRVSSSGDDTTYELTVSDAGADDHGDTLADATTITMGAAPIAGTLAIDNDVDVFKLSLAVGDIVRFTCTSTSGVACGLTVVGPNGTASVVSAAQATETGVLATIAGTYRVEVRSGYSSTSNAYTIAATRGQDDFTTVTPLTLATTLSGNIDYAGDTETFSLALTAGTVLRLAVTGVARVQVSSPSGSYVTSAYGGTSSTSFSATTTGTYTFFVAASFSSVPVGAYSLTVQ